MADCYQYSIERHCNYMTIRISIRHEYRTPEVHASVGHFAGTRTCVIVVNNKLFFVYGE